MPGRRFDHDIVESPVAPAMREALLRSPRAQDDLKAFIKARIGFFERYGKAFELTVPTALTDSEIEPTARHEIKSRGLLGENYRIVPGQHHHRGAEAERAGTRSEPGEQGHRSRHLMPSREVVLDQKRAAIPQRLCLDVEVDEVMEPLPRDCAAAGAAGLSAAKNSKLHRLLVHLGR